MKKITAFVAWCLVFTGVVFAAGRDDGAVLRKTSNSAVNVRNNNSGTVRSATQQKSVTTRTATSGGRNVSSRKAKSSTRNATLPRNATSVRSIRSAINRVVGRLSGRSATNTARVANSFGTTNTISFDENYEICRDAYFTCMDQFCALQNEKYKRCVCSSKLETIQNRERAIGQTKDQLQDFKDLNIESILKTPEEVKAMLTASSGESALSTVRDKSEANKKLTTISDVLNNTRLNAVSTQGQLDIGGDINQIWTTTDLISGADIANLTGASLYNAVHSQCSEMVADQCASKQTLSVVVSAYGMYIENDCATLLSALEKQSVTANANIRQTQREMNNARLENYNAHNSSGINDCIAMVRSDVTADSACGENYVHCLDLTGKYLDRTTGAPIYSTNFYELDTQISLSGDVLTNSTNSKLVTELNKKRKFAEKSLETCRDISDEVWDEYLRQAITEIYQHQQEKIRNVKDTCVDIVNKCYDEKTSQLRDYSNIADQMLLGSRLELSEELCSDNLTMCSNLYGGGPEGLQLLLTEMHNIVNQKIAQNCLVTLQEYAKKLCMVPTTDTHSYPYGCRVYSVGGIQDAQRPECNYSPEQYSGPHTTPESSLWNPIDSSYPSDTFPLDLPEHAPQCLEARTYTSCNTGFYLYNAKCHPCPEPDTDWYCAGGTAGPRNLRSGCGDEYVGSLYQKMVSYAKEYCVRPSISTANGAVIPTEVLGDVNTVMDSIKIDMAAVLATECENLGGIWKTAYDAQEPHKFMDFYNQTNAHISWGLCSDPNP